MYGIGNEASDFVRACEAIHALMAHSRLTAEDRELIECSGIELLSKLTSEAIRW